MISSWSNPERSSAKLSVNTRDDAISKVTLCLKRAALRERDTSESCDNLSITPDILKYLDIRKKNPRKTSSTLESLVSRLSRSGTTLKYISHRADAMLKNLKSSFNAGKMRISLRLAEDLLTLSSSLEDLHRHRISAYHYLSLIHAALGRHDRACSAVAMMVRLSKSTDDAALLSRALVTLGKVHLSFGHLEAAARVWERLSIHVEHPVLRAWMHHEIGRCHLETGKYAEALRKAVQCRECADEANSKKWTFHAGLLRAQCLAMLGRFAEAYKELRVAAKISEEEGDTPTLSYIRDLIEQLSRALREVTFAGEDRCLKSTPRRLSPRKEELDISEGNEAITTSGIRKTTARSKGDDASTPSFCSDYLDKKILDRREIDEESSSLDSAMSSRSKRSNLTYMIESRMNVSSKDKPDEMKMYDDKLMELLSRESQMTFRTCDVESRHFIDEEKILASLKQPIECFSNVETNDRRTECETFRISRSCENEWSNFDNAVNRTYSDPVARTSHKHLLSFGTQKQNDEKESFVREPFSGFQVPI
ncbi:outer dynein arm-docking complex subunit 4-like [Linepithema humile]|uniref:outer dynein arm-docking complex subunit 4-like n=1 Tax=Linepithema humile TaxID=83485 RepID=UPI00351F2DAB